VLSLAALSGLNAEGDPAAWAKLESSRRPGLFIAYPPTVFDAVRSPEDHPATIIADVDRLVSRSGDVEVVIGADDAAVGSASEYIRIELASDRDVHPSMKVSYGALAKGWKVASGLIDGRVYYYKSVECCAPKACEISTLSTAMFTYMVGGKSA